jgi:hypothetical protein
MLLTFLFLLEGIAVPEEKQVADIEEREIIEVLEILEDYDFLLSMELYENLDEKDRFQNIKSLEGKTEKEEKK